MAPSDTLLEERDRAAGVELAKLLSIMRRLRVGCPWDREQDLRSLRPYLVEETYEVLDALDSGDLAELREELGDLLFQIVFQSHLAEERGAFEMADVVRGIAGKLMSRHPHVFGEKPPLDAEAALRSWAALKKAERQGKGQLRPSALDGVPREAPALLRAERLGEKAARSGFDWTAVSEVRAKVDEELGELDAAMAQGVHLRMEEELGDLLFTLCNLARWLKTPAEDALRGAITRFDRRFRYVEAVLHSRGRTPEQAPPAELEALWQEAKRNEQAELAVSSKPGTT
ncbi:MAG: nucleoside triphosphate pyrophosphohydrolase [Myxococcales bacterium]